jgi:hypothetical protein
VVFGLLEHQKHTPKEKTHLSLILKTPNARLFILQNIKNSIDNRENCFIFGEYCETRGILYFEMSV